MTCVSRNWPNESFENKTVFSDIWVMPGREQIVVSRATLMFQKDFTMMHYENTPMQDTAIFRGC